MEYVLLFIGLVLGVVLGYYYAKSLAPSGANPAELQRLQTDLDTLSRQEAAASRELNLLRETIQQQQQEWTIAREKLEGELKHTRDSRDQLDRTLTERNAELRAQAERLEAQKQFLEENAKQLEEKFDALARKALQDQSQQFTETSTSKLSETLKPLKEELDKFKKDVTERDTKAAETTGRLEKELEMLQKLNQDMLQGANNLTKALRGDTKVQGDWGELQLEALLQHVGLERGVQYHVQHSFRDETTGRQLRPDVLFTLPDGRQIIMDSKVSLVDYTAWTEAATDAERETRAKALVGAVRNHITGLSGKDYAQLTGGRSPDFVILFMPLEPAFLLALKEAPGLYNEAFKRHVVLASTTTLLGLLRVIHELWRQDNYLKNAHAIAERGGKLYDKFKGFIDDLNDIEDKVFVKGRKAFKAAQSKLYEGDGNLVRQAEMLRELGAKVKKPLGSTTLEKADLLDSLDVDGGNTPPEPPADTDSDPPQPE